MTTRTGTAKTFLVNAGITQLTLMFWPTDREANHLDSCQIDVGEGSTLRCEGDAVEPGALIEWFMELKGPFFCVLEVDEKGVSRRSEFVR